MAKKTRTLAVICPFCNDADATLSLDMSDLDAITCSSCDETFSARQAHAKVVEALAKWARVMEWIDSAPAE